MAIKNGPGISNGPKTPEIQALSPKDCIVAETRDKVNNLAMACAIAGAVALGNAPAMAETALVSPYEPLAGTETILASNGNVIPPKWVVSLFKHLGYDTKTINAVAETVTHMEAAQAKLGNNVVLGAMLSESRADKPKILKDTANNPAESFSALFGTKELTMANHETVFERLLPDKFQIAGYKKRVAGLGPDMANAWFQTFNAVVRKMPAQNTYLLQQALITTSSIYSYNNPTLNIANISPSVVADQLHRLMLLVSDDSFTVARLMYGDTIDTAVSRRLPTREVLKKIFGASGITLPESLYDIAEAGALEMGVGTDKYTELAMKKRGVAELAKENAQTRQENAQTRQENAQTRQENAQTKERTEKNNQETRLMSSTFDLYARIDKNLQSFIKNPTDSGLIKNIRSDMVALRAIRNEWESLSVSQKEDKPYQESMKLIAKIEQAISMHKISL